MDGWERQRRIGYHHHPRSSTPPMLFERKRCHPGDCAMDPPAIVEGLDVVKNACPRPCAWNRNVHDESTRSLGREKKLGCVVTAIVDTAHAYLHLLFAQMDMNRQWTHSKPGGSVQIFPLVRFQKRKDHMSKTAFNISAADSSTTLSTTALSSADNAAPLPSSCPSASFSASATASSCSA